MEWWGINVLNKMQIVLQLQLSCPVYTFNSYNNSTFGGFLFYLIV